MTKPNEKRSEPVFARPDSPWVDFLRETARPATSEGFPARNFLLDEGVNAERAESYDFAAEVTDAGRWTQGHSQYLDKAVRLEKRGHGFPKKLDPQRLPERCPETFRFDDNLRLFGKAHGKLKLLRFQPVPSLVAATSLGPSVDQVVDAARECLAARREEREPDENAERRLVGLLGAWNQICDLRPAYVAFQADHDDLFAENPENDAAGWADTLRDRLGLAHVDPAGAGTPIPVFVFRYAVRDVPTRKGFAKDRHALAVPSVLDGELSPAFCPAPRTSEHGRVVDLSVADLSDEDRAPSREVLHPYRDLVPAELFRVGAVERPVPADLGPPRAAHLRRLAEDYPGYGEATDADLLEAS